MAAAKSALSTDQAALQITRDLDPSYLASYPSSISLTYSYRATDATPAPPPGVSSWIDSGYDGVSAGGFQRFTAAQITAFDSWVKLLSDVANITVTRIGSGTTTAAYSDAGQVLLGNFTTGESTKFSAGFATYIFDLTDGVYSRAGYVALNGKEGYNTAPSLDNYGFSTALHEFMHVLGLSHPGDYNAGASSPTYAKDATYAQDSGQYTLMSYFAETETGANYGGLYGATPLLHDIAALQRLYGANTTTRTDDSVYGFNSSTGLSSFTLTNNASARVFTIWDAGGTDTLDLSGYSTVSRIDLRQEAFSSAGTRPDGGGLMVNNISIAKGVVIENAKGGAGADVITGNDGNNKITGNGGNDQIDGGAGIDTSIYQTAFSAASITFSGVNATIATAVDGTDALVNVERLSFTDRVVALDVGAGQNAGYAYRLYQAAFARTPDLPGLTFWTNALDTGRFTPQGVSGGFVGSPEFKSVYGAAPSAADIVDRFYHNVLDRAGEPGGTAFWIGYIEAGNAISSVLSGFSESPENQARLAPIIGQGITLDPTLLS